MQVHPCVLHGDLWSGNMSSVDGQPAIFDPAVYYGHSEAEFGMSWCAGFSRDFYAGYHEVLPQQKGRHCHQLSQQLCGALTSTSRKKGITESGVLSSAGAAARKQIYSLYHYLNHNNLFGGSYYYQCESTLSALTSGL